MILHHVDNWPRRASSLLWLLLPLATLLWAPRAIGATQTLQAATCTAPAATLALPAASIQPNTPVGTLIGTPATTSIIFTCNNLPVSSNGKTTGTVSTADRTAVIQAGDNLAPLDPTNVPAGPGITFATNLSGIALLVTATPVQASSLSGGNPGNDGPGSLPGYPVGSVTGPTAIPEKCNTSHGTTTCTFTCVTASGGSPANTSGCFTGNVSESFTAQLKVTGPLTSASIGSINAIQLMPFWWYIPGGDQDSTSQQISGSVLNLAGGTAVTMQACTINTDSQNKTVTLPAVVTNALTAIGATAGTTQFNINLTCQSGATASITMTTANQATATGVIAPTVGTGFAKNVGVRILNSSSAPITFGTEQSLGATPSGARSLSYFAQYYVTATPVAAGNVAGTVTFTMAYQ
jgi:type 1 fimbria pilin